MTIIKMGAVQEFDIIEWKGVQYVVNEIVKPNSAIGLSVHKVEDRSPNVFVGHKTHDITLVKRNKKDLT